MKQVAIVLFVLLAWARFNGAYYILITNHSGNYNISTSLPAWQRLDASNAPAFIVADDITVPIQLTRCDELVVDVTLLIARGTIPTEPTNATFWVFSNSTMASGGRFDAALAVATQTFAAPSEGSWSPASAVLSWTVGPQEFYVVTPRFRINNNVVLRGNVTYWIAMLIGQERRISPVDSTFNTPRLLLTGTPSSPLGSAAPLRGIDFNGTMFRAFPGLINWSNATAVEAAALPFLSNTGTVSLTHQMSFTVYVSACYAPANVIIPSTRNFTTLPSPTAYAAPTPPISVNEPWSVPSPIRTPVPSPRTPVPSPARIPTPSRAPVPSPVLSPALSPRIIAPVWSPTPHTIPSPHESPSIVDEPSPEDAPIEQTEVPASSAPTEPPMDVNPPASRIATILTDPFSSPAFIVLLVCVIILVIIITVGVFILASRRYRARIAREGTYNEVYDETKEIELTDDDGSVQLSADSSDSGEFQSRSFNNTMNAADLELQSDADAMTAVPIDPAPSSRRNKGQ